MIIYSFRKTNMASKTVRKFHMRLAGLAIFYVIIAILYLLGLSETITGFMGGDPVVAGALLQTSLFFFGFSLVFFIAFLELKWHILRTVILATSLLSVAYLLCAVLMLIWPVSDLHLLILLVIGGLFLIIFIQQSNIRIYWKDGKYADAAIETLVALFFLLLIGRMIVMALAGETS